MTGRARSGVFLSYARKDGEPFAAMLRERLHEKAPDIAVMQDRSLLEGGVGWWKQLAEAIDSVEFLVRDHDSVFHSVGDGAEGVEIRPSAGRVCVPGQGGARL